MRPSKCAPPCQAALVIEVGDTADSERVAELERRREAVLKLQSVNSDITGWVKLDGTDINFPVLTPPAGDPQYYLYRNYKKESTKYGSIFLDGMCTVDSDNQVLHGHSMQDGRMFWQVIGFGSAKTVKSCPVFLAVHLIDAFQGRLFHHIIIIRPGRLGCLIPDQRFAYL